MLTLLTSGVYFFFSFLEIKRFQNQNSWDYEIPNTREESLTKCVDLGTPGSRDLTIARFGDREIGRSQKNKNSIDLSFAKINIASLENPQ